jgi:hypothetical protein
MCSPNHRQTLQEQILADNTKERTQAEAQFKKTQKQQEGAAAMAAYVAEAHIVGGKALPCSCVVS